MIYVKINDTLYPATITGEMKDWNWGERPSKSITVEMSHVEASALFVDGVAWSMIEQIEVPELKTDENGYPVPGENGMFIQIGTKIKETEQDFSEYDLAGDLIDHRDGKITAKMGKHTAEELLAVIMGGK